MYVDIHTHIRPLAGRPAVYNVPEEWLDRPPVRGECGWWSAGVHPWQAGGRVSGRLERLGLWAADARVVALGECGLDRHASAPLAVQTAVLEAQARLAEEAGKPLVIHCVGRFNELLHLRRLWRPRQVWIVHGFRGKPQLAEQVLREGCALSYGGRFHPESVRLTPLDRLYVETDESLMPIEGIYRCVAAAKGCLPECLTAGSRLLGRAQ